MNRTLKTDTVIFHVGGNGENIKYFREHNESLIYLVNDDDRCIIVSRLLPMKSTDIEPYNLCVLIMQWNVLMITTAYYSGPKNTCV